MKKMKTKTARRTRSLPAIGLASASLFASADLLTLKPGADVGGEGSILSGSGPTRSPRFRRLQ